MSNISQQIFDVLKGLKSGASTRHLCNLLFNVETEKYIVRPGKNRMDQVYRSLKSMEKRGMVKVDYPGHWYIVAG